MILIRRLPFSLARAGALASAGALAVSFGLPAAPIARADDATVSVTIGDKGCEPNVLTAASGKTTFKVKNASRRVVEWEILKGVDIVAERENMLPGLVQTLTATLASGEYQITCGLKSNPKGTLEVTGAPRP